MGKIIGVIAGGMVMLIMTICYCVCKVASDADDWMEKMLKEKEEEDE